MFHKDTRARRVCNVLAQFIDRYLFDTILSVEIEPFDIR